MSSTTSTRDNAQRLSAAAMIAALEASPTTTTTTTLTQEVPMSTTNLIPADLMAQLRDAVANVQQLKTAASTVTAHAPAIVDSTDNTTTMGAMPRQMADKWAELRLTPEWPVIVRYNARGVPLNKFGAFIGKADKTRAGLVLDPNTTLAPARPKPAPTPAPEQPAVQFSGDALKLLDALRTLGLLKDERPADPAPTPVVVVQPEEPTRISIADFQAMYPEVMDDLKSAVLGTVFVPGGSWAVFRQAILGR